MINPAWRHATPVLLALALVLPIARGGAGSGFGQVRQDPLGAGAGPRRGHRRTAASRRAGRRRGAAQTRPHYSEAARWYREAAKQGRATAQLALAFMLNAGRGVAKDEMASFRWLSRAAEHGHVEAQFMLSIYHNHDMVRSHAWLIVAASQGHKIAISMLDVNRSIRPAEVVAQAEELATDLCQGMANPSSC